MAYSQALVIVGGLAHIPVVTGLFWVFDRSLRPTKVKAKKTLTKTPKEPPKTKDIVIEETNLEILKPKISDPTNIINIESNKTQNIKLENEINSEEVINEIESDEIEKKTSNLSDKPSENKNNDKA